MLRKLATAVALATVSISCAVSAQTVGTGAYPFASFDNPGFDSVNLGNLNTRFAIPIVQKSGRGLPFSYVLQYEGLVWTPVVGTSTTAWVPNPTWGFAGVLNGTAFAGYLTHNIRSVTCGSAPTGGGGRLSAPSENLLSGYVFHDAFGANHPFSYAYTGPCSNGSLGATTSGSTTAGDGSGYTLVNNATQVESRNGIIVTPGTSSTTASPLSETDSNGNEISYGGTNGAFTDTLGTTPLTISGGGPVTFTYPVVKQAGGVTTASATLYYKAYTVQTNFGCSGIVEYGATTINLVDHITLADNSEYFFTYEATPGTTDGAVTGRMASITLPTGGAISYAYSGGCTGSGGTGSGIMADGSTAGLSRTTSDSTTPRTYARATVNANATSTTLTDQKSNVSAFQFTDYAGDYYETQRLVYQGAATGTPLLERSTCYNSAAAPCNGAALTAQITADDVTENYNGGSQSLTYNSYDTYGNLLLTSQSSGGSTFYTTTNTYNSLSELTASTTTTASSSDIAFQVAYGYDETTPTATSGLPQHVAVTGIRGNQTSAHLNPNGGTSALSTTTAYYDTGMPVSTTTPNGTASYSYDPTQTFATQTTLPTPSSGVSLSTSATYDAASGAVLTSTGLNAGQTTTVNSYDSRLRPLTVTLPNGGQITYVYYYPNEASVTQNMNLSTGQNSAQYILYDAYGRPSRGAVSNGQSTNVFYQTDTCYDATGLTEFVATPYQANGYSVAEHCSGAGTSYVRDALGRPTSITNADGTATIQYYDRAVETTDVNGIQKITQYDVLGRTTGVCEITSTALNGVSPGPCGMDITPATGFVTSYAYNLATHVITVTQGQQTRTFVTDASGRTISITEPERGTTAYTYAYNSTGLQVVRTRPTVNQTNPSTVTQTTTQYDSIGRPVSVSYSDGTAVAKNYYYDVLPSSLGWSQAVTNPKGMLVSTSSGVAGTSLARSEFSYDVMGNVIGMVECGPSICGGSSQNTRTMQFAYDLENHLTVEVDPTSGTIDYGLSPAGEITSITNETYQVSGASGAANLVSNVVNGPFGPTSYALGNGLDAVMMYDNLGRNNGGWVCSGTTATYCTGGTQLYGNTAGYKGNQMGQICDTVWQQCQISTYDALNRLTAVTDTSHVSGDAGSFTYTYDRWGNRLSQTATSGSGSSPVGTVNAATNQLSSVAYDAAGNQESDGISHTFTYDAEGNVIAVDNGNTAKYVYDAMNHRVETITSAGTYEYVYDAQGRRTSMWLASENFGVEGRSYWGSKQIAYRGYGGNTYFEHQNYLGTERLRTNYAGAVAATEFSLTYGDDLNQTVDLAGGDQDTSQYAGQEHDAESGSEHAQFRQYSSTQGRWMSPDPYDGSYSIGDPQSLNRYSYVEGNPLGGTDPSGLCPPSKLDISEGASCNGGGGGSGDDGDDDGFYIVDSPTGIYTYDSLEYLSLIAGGGGLGLGESLNSSGEAWVNNSGIEQDTDVNITQESISSGEFPNFSSIPTGNVSVSYSSSFATNNGQTWSETWQAAKSCAASSFGLSTAAAGGAVASGLPAVSTAGKFAGMTAGTSVASQFFRSILPQAIGSTWAPTISNPLAASGTLGGVVGRWVPVIGEAVLAYQAGKFVSCYWASDENY